MIIPFSDQPDNQQQGDTASTADTNQKLHPLLQDTSYIMAPGNDVGNCVQTNPTDESAGTVVIDHPVADLSLIGGGVLAGGLAGHYGVSLAVSRQMSSDRVMFDGLSTDYAARRDLFLSGLTNRINSMEEPGRVAAAYNSTDPLYTTSFTFDAEYPALLNRFAPGNNLDARDNAVKDFLAQSQDDVLSGKYKVPPQILTTAQAAEIGALKNDLNQVQPYNRTATKAAEIIGESPESFIKNASPPPNLPAGEMVTFTDITERMINAHREAVEHGGNDARYTTLMNSRAAQRLNAQDITNLTNTLNAQGGPAAQHLIDVLRLKAELNANMTIINNDSVLTIQGIQNDVAQRYGQLHGDVAQAYDKFEILKAQIRKPNPGRDDTLATHRATRQALIDDKAKSPSEATLDTARFLSGAPRQIHGVDVGITRNEFNRFAQLHGASQVAEPEGRGFFRTLAKPAKETDIRGRTNLGGAAGGILGGLAGFGLAYAIEDSGNGETGTARTRAQCEVDAADQLLNKGSYITGDETGTNSPAFILKGQNYDFGSQALSGLKTAQTDAELENLDASEKTSVLQKINEDRDIILSKPHNIDAIEQELSRSPFMIDPHIRQRITTQLVNTANNAHNEIEHAKALRDVAVWNLAYLDAATRQHTITVPQEDIDSSKQFAKRAIQLARDLDGVNPDLPKFSKLIVQFGVQ